MKAKLRQLIFIPAFFTAMSSTFAETSATFRDPTLPLITQGKPKAKGGPVEYQLFAIGRGASGYYAVVNNQVVRVGDVIGNAEIVSIDKKNVVISDRGIRERLSVRPAVLSADPKGSKG